MTSIDHSGCLTENGHDLIQRVYFEDTDFSGRVYHARYLHFLERGRSDYLRLLGIPGRRIVQFPSKVRTTSSARFFER